MIAASAILTSRSVAAVSGLWTIQATWDIPAQKEILSAQISTVCGQFEADDARLRHSGLFVDDRFELEIALPNDGMCWLRLRATESDARQIIAYSVAERWISHWI